jgi:glycosyltransferase involved in cell wall biosynthesis
LSEKPKVSVAIFTYNHERYIAQALESVVRQKTTFPFEVVVGEDCSTDATRDIVVDFQSRYPDIIRPLLNRQRLGQYGNVIQTFNACRGEYIAVVEGDDYWTSDDKLQVQADFLDAHPDCAMCFHQVIYESEDGSRPPKVVPEHHKPVSTIEDLLAGNFIPTCANMFRKGPSFRIPEWTQEVHFTDWPMHVMNARSGSIAFIPRCMGVYRLHAGGVWSTLSWRPTMERWLRAYEYINADLDFRYDRIIKRAMFLRRYGYATDRLEKGDAERATAVWEAIRMPPTLAFLDKKLLLLVKCYAPFIVTAAGKTRRALRAVLYSFD